MSISSRPSYPLSRRAVLAASVALPLTAACSSSSGRPTAGAPSGVVRQRGWLVSRHWPGHRARWVLMRPDGARRPPTVVSLHGKDGEAERTFTDLEVQRHILSTGLAVAAVDGGNYYWHARRSESTGDDSISSDTPPCDTGAMVTDDFIPLLGRLGLDTSRIGLFGWSMGGYGALLLATRLGAARVAGVGALSAALWLEPADSAPGAFDNAEDFRRNDVFAQRSRFARIPIRLACGTSDYFFESDRAFVDGFPDVAAYDVSGTFDAGGHDAAYWAGHAGDLLTFLAQHLRHP